MIQSLTQSFHKIQKALVELKLSINAKKTKVVRFGHGGGAPSLSVNFNTINGDIAKKVEV